MQKALRLLLCTIMVLAAFGFYPQSSVKAESYSSYVSGITMVNMSGLSASVTISYYRGGTGADAGTLATSTTSTVVGHALVDYAAIPVSTFRGAVVISSSQPIAAISTITGGGMGRGEYTGASTGSKSVLLPFLAKNHGSGKWNTFVAVQNIGQNDTTVNVNYANCPAAVDASAVVKPGSSVIFNQATATCLPNGITSAVITSTVENILAVVDQESTITNTALVSSGFPAGSPSIAIPLVNANNPDVNGWRTAITIMNVGNQDTVLTLTYQRTDGTTCTEKQTILKQKSNVFGGATLTAGNRTGVVTTCAVGARLVGAAYIAKPTDNSTNQPLIAIVNQDRAGYASAYDSFDRTIATNHIVIPRILDNNGSAQWASSFNVMNVGPAKTFVKCTYAGSTRVATSPSAGLPINGVFEDLPRGKLGGIKMTSAECRAYTSAAYTTIDANAKIVAVVNERALSATGDGLMSYEAINTTP